MRAFRGLSAFFLTTVLALGAGVGAASAGTVRAVTTPDSDFLATTAQTGLAQRQLGQTAVTQAGATSVKKFAKTVVAHRRALDTSLAKLARAQTFTLPTAVAATDVNAVETVTVATGDQFDLAYAQLERSMYARTVRDFRTEIKVGKNHAVVAFAKDHLKVLQQDAAKAKMLAKHLADGMPSDYTGNANCASSGSSGNNSGTGSSGTAPGAASAPAAGGTGGGIAGCASGSGSGSNDSGAGNNG